MDLRDYLRIIRRRWRIITASVVLTVATAVTLTFTATPQYASTARMFVSTPQSDSAAAYQGGLFSQQRVASYADLISGEDIAQRVVDDLGIDTDPGVLADQVSATVVPETVILDITVTDANPQRAQTLAQSYAERLADYVAELETPPGKIEAPIKLTVTDSASLPSAPVSPQPARNIGLALVLGLLLGVGLAVLRETLDRTVTSPETLAEATDASLLGAIAYDAEAAKKPILADSDTHSPRVEAFRVLRTNLQFLDVDLDAKVFVITSSVPGDGKTTTASNLAVTLAQSGQRVALVEADLRRPRVAEYLHLEGAVGLTTVLVGRVELDEALQPYGQHGLTVLTSGATPPNPAELVQSQAMSDVLGKLKARFDVIIVDAPPLLPVTDAAPLTAQSDGALLVVRHGRTTRDQVRGSVERLGLVNGRLLGVVLNMSPARTDSYYGYGYGYGYGPDSAATAAVIGSRPKPGTEQVTGPDAGPDSAPPKKSANGTEVPAQTRNELPRKTRWGSRAKAHRATSAR